MVRIFMVRHGETVNNKERKMQGWCDSPLTELGVQQAKAAGKELSGIQFEAVYTSDLPRQKKTALLILGENTTAFVPEIRTDNRFRETSYGSFEGVNIDETFRIASKDLSIELEEGQSLFDKLGRKEVYDLIAKADPDKKAETGNETAKRMVEGVLSVAAKAEEALYEDRTPEVLVVSSGGALGLLLEEIDPDGLFSHKVSNGDFIVLEVNRGKIVLKEHSARR